MLLSFVEPDGPRGATGDTTGWDIHGEGENRFGKYVVEGHVSPGGVVALVRTGPMPRRLLGSPELSASKVASEARVERKRRREEAARRARSHCSLPVRMLTGVALRIVSSRSASMAFSIV